MSNSDSFIDEVTEEVRRDKLFGYFRKYGWIAVVVVLLVVGGAAYNEWRKAQAEAAAQAFGDAVMSALETEDQAARAAALQAIVTNGPNSVVLKMLTASDALGADDTAGALAALDAVAADNTLAASYRDLAALKRVLIAGSSVPAADRIAALEPLAVAGRPYRPLAMEQLALVRIETGETETALGLLRDVLEEPQITAGLRNRVSQMMIALGADPDAG